MVVDTQLCSQIQALSQVEGQRGITEDLRLILNHLYTLKQFHWVSNALRREGLITTIRIILIFQDASGINHIILDILAIKLYWQPRQLLNHRTQSALSIGIIRGVITPRVVDQQINACREPLGRVIIVGQFSIDTLIIGIAKYTLLIGEVKECTHRRAIVARALDAELMVMRHGYTRTFLLPIGIIKRITITIEITGIGEYLRQVGIKIHPLELVGILKSLLESTHPLRSIHNIHLTGHAANRQRTIVLDMHALTGIASLGGYHNHTIGTTCTIDSSRRGIFQHLDTLDIVRIQELEISHGHTINNIQRT